MRATNQIFGGATSPSDNEQHQIPYRKDVDGLRALAILSVLSFHLFPTAVPGGFVGVDVFFVISGYLISSIIFYQHAQGGFSFLKFYARRIRRLFPALLVVLLAVYVFAQINFLDYENKELTKHVIRSALFVLNFTLANQVGYFDTSAEEKPLLHLWSLSVEEQFYILFPLVFVMTSVLVRNFGWIVIAGLLTSFTACVIWTARDPNAAFYMPFTRFWELFIGVAVAWFNLEHRKWPNGWRNICAWAGAGMVVLACFAIDLRSGFPGFAALLPTVGCALLIAAGPETGPARTIFSSRPAIWIGLISYPLYLWHWPLLSIAKITEGTELSTVSRLSIGVASIALAWATYRLIEQPIRRPQHLMPKAAALTAAMTIMLLVAFMAQKYDGVLFPGSRTAEAKGFLYDWKNGYRLGKCFQDALDSNSGPGAFDASCSGLAQTAHPESPHWIIWGDSHAASLYPGLKRLAGKTGARLGQFNAAACPPVLGFSVAKRPECEAINDYVFKQIEATRPDVVFLGAYWGLFNGRDGWENLPADAIEKTLARLTKLPLTQIILFLHLPIFEINQQRVAIKAFEDGGRVRTYRGFKHKVKDHDKDLKAIASKLGIQVVSPIDLLCRADGCLVSLETTKVTPLAWDYGHLTDAGSNYLIKKALEVGVLKVQGSPR